MHAARDLAALGPMVIAAGGVVIEVLETKGFVTAPAMPDLQAWINAYNLHVTTVMDPPGTGTPTLSALGVRESCFIIDLSTMQIVQKFNGSVLGLGMSGVGQAVPAILTLLGH